MTNWHEHRSQEKWTWQALDLEDRFIGDLSGVRGGDLRMNLANQIKTGGSMNWSGLREDEPDWLNIRVRPVYSARLPNGEIIQEVMGTFIPAAPVMEWDGKKASIKVELFDKLQLPDQVKTLPGFAKDKGVAPTTVVQQILMLLGQEHFSITSSPAVLRAPMAWKPGTKFLTIINDLLKSVNYGEMYADVNGMFRAEPHIPTDQRTVAWEFLSGETSIHSPKFKHSDDYFGIPNRVTLISRGTDTLPAMISTAVLPPEDPLSLENREPIDIVETEVDADSQATLDALAERRLQALTLRTRQVDFTHALVPIALNDVVKFWSKPAGVQLTGLVQSMTIPCESGRLVSTTVQQVGF